jgi:hypothetical protein
MKFLCETMEKYAGEKQIVSQRYEKYNSITFVFRVFLVNKRNFNKYSFTVWQRIQFSTTFALDTLLLPA